MQLDGLIDRRCRLVGLTKEDEHSVATQYAPPGKELARVPVVDVQSRRRKIVER